MCFFRRKNKKLMKKYASNRPKVEEETKFKMGQFVHFRFRDELYFGYVNRIYKNTSGQIVYDIQVGGQCPAIIRGVEEKTIFILEEKRKGY